MIPGLYHELAYKFLFKAHVKMHGIFENRKLKNDNLLNPRNMERIAYQEGSLDYRILETEQHNHQSR
jgi:hypothetical protein